MPWIKKFSDADILAALNSSTSLNKAAQLLGMARSGMQRRCLTPELMAAHAACIARGTRNQGGLGAMSDAELDALERQAAAQ